jgi:hypothetical protein
MLGPRGSGLITHPSADRGHGEGIGHSVCDDAKRRNRRKQLHHNREQHDWNECFQPPSHDFPKSASGVIAPRRVDVETTAEAGCRLSGAPSLTAVRLPGCGEQHPCRRGNTFRTDHGVSRPPIPNQRPAKFWNTKFLTGACQNRRLEQMELPARFGAAMSAAGIFNSKPATGVNDYVRRKFLPLPLLRAARLSECH